MSVKKNVGKGLDDELSWCAEVLIGSDFSLVDREDREVDSNGMKIVELISAPHEEGESPCFDGSSQYATGGLIQGQPRWKQRRSGDAPLHEAYFWDDHLSRIGQSNLGVNSRRKLSTVWALNPTSWSGK